MPSEAKAVQRILQRLKKRPQSIGAAIAIGRVCETGEVVTLRELRTLEAEVIKSDTLARRLFGIRLSPPFPGAALV